MNQAHLPTCFIFHKDRVAVSLTLREQSSKTAMRVFLSPNVTAGTGPQKIPLADLADAPIPLADSTR